MSKMDRSRSSRYRYVSASSLSSGSFGGIHSSHSSERSNKSTRNRRSTNEINDKNHSRRYSNEQQTNYNKEPEHDRTNFKEYHREKEKDSEKYMQSDRHESSEEESYLKCGLYMEHEVKPAVSEKSTLQIKDNNFEESMQDPSACNYHSTFHGYDNDFTAGHEKLTKSLEERKGDRDETSSRLERLERLVELLASNNKNLESSPTNPSQENDWCTGIRELIPRNNEFTTSMWLNKIEDECIERNFDEKQSIQFIKSKMTGIVKAWYKTISSYDFTWPELKMLIIKLFPDNNDFANSLKLLVGRTKKPSETVTQYYFSKMYLLEACKISGINAVSCLIDGLENEFWKQEAKSYNFLTPEALYSQYLLKCNEYDSSYRQQKPHELTEVYITETDHRESNLAESYKNKKCFTCHKFGHIAADCRHAPICYNCQNTGHISANCPLRNQI